MERSRRVEISDVVRANAGAAGSEQWLEDLPILIDSLCADWGIEVGQPLDGGTEAYVAEARTHTGDAAVLKLLVPSDGGSAGHEITALTHAPSSASVTLLRHDDQRSAMLLERLGPSMNDHELALAERHRILTALAQRYWVPLPAEVVLPTGAEKAAWLSRNIIRLWELLDRPCAESTVAHALACAERRREAHDDERSVLVHGDIHEWNALQAGSSADASASQPGSGWKLVDPDGLRAEPEYDLGILMREDPIELAAEGDPRSRSRWLSRQTSLDEQAIWEWGVVERVSTGLVATEIGLQPVGRQMLELADRLVTAT